MHRFKQQQKMACQCFDKFLHSPFRFFIMLKTDFFHILIFSSDLRFLQTSCVTMELESLEIHNFKSLWYSVHILHTTYF